MLEGDFAERIGPALAAAIDDKGYTTLTPVQQAVLAPALEGRDLRITSQTGSGKTVAIGFVLRALVAEPFREKTPVAHPRAMVIAPTRELAQQVEEELSWLYAKLGAKVASATGGTNIRDERRALASGPAVVVGTPGRLLDHLNRGAIDPSQLGAIVLDEADRMLDLGFREELEAILAYAPDEHQTHLVSATFPRDVLMLANRVQSDPAHVEGTRLGAANADIDHVIHLVDAHDRMGAMINLLLAYPDEQVLIFARMRSDVAEISRQLNEAGFRVSSLSGEMEQPERNRALAAFKRGHHRALVATDVAARGIDVQDIARVIHAEPPTDPDSYTHRSGRTGRAGRKGTSSVLVIPSGLRQATSLLMRARVPFRFEAIPSADSIRQASDKRLVERLTMDDPPEFEGFDDRLWGLAKRLAAADNPARSFARLLLEVRAKDSAEPRDVRVIEPPAPARPRAPEPLRGNPRERDARPATHARDERGAQGSRAPPRAQRVGGWVPFHVTWGFLHGADARRLLAMICRRGNIQSQDVGAIRVGRTASIVEVASDAAESFARAVDEPDPRNPKVKVRRDRAAAPETHSERSSSPKDRPSRPKDRPSIPKDRASIPKDRPSRARAAKKSADDPVVPAPSPSRRRIR